MERIKKTKGGLLEDSYRWTFGNEEFKRWQSNQNQTDRLLWIRGDPGKGKTMLLCGIIQELTRSLGNIVNVPFFFCQATDGRINTATAVLRGLIYSIVGKQPHLLSHVQDRYQKAGKALFEGMNAWSALSSIFTDILKDPGLRSTFFIIDALDECTTGLPLLLDLIMDSSARYQLKWLVSSRNWPHIIERLDTMTWIAPISLELNETSVSKAVDIFIQYKVSQLAIVKKYSETTHDTIYGYLLSHSQGTFLWVALVCQELDKTPRRHVLKHLSAFPSGLDALYGRMIDQVRQSEDAELCKQILAIMLTVYRPITLDELSSLIEVPDEALQDDYDEHRFLFDIIAVCGSFLTLRQDTIVFIHQSAKDFLLQGASNDLLPHDIEAEHYRIFTYSLKTMLTILRRDIFNIKLPGVSMNDVRAPSPNPLTAAQYACVYWVDHLENGKSNVINTLDKGGLVDVFLQQSYLYWLEALSILGNVSYGIQAIQKLEVLIQEGGSQALLNQVRDASRFIRYYRTAIEISPLQVYYSPLVFSPKNSLTRSHFQKERPNWVLNNPIVEKDWSACLQTLYGHSAFVVFIAWSQDGGQLASMCHNNKVRIWDPTTGQCIPLEGHEEPVESIAWSQDGSRLASMSYDRTVRVWDATTGQSIFLEGQIASVKSITWSPDGSRLASVCLNNTVRIWNPTTGHCIPLEGHQEPVKSITWSPDGSRLALVSIDRTARIWDPTTGRSISILKRPREPVGSREPVFSVTWSPDGDLLASASIEDTAIRIWDPITGRCICLQGHTARINSIAWSHDGSRIASASYDRTVRVWESTTGRNISTFQGHTESVNSVAWSQDGSRIASASNDRTVRIWDPTINQRDSTLKAHGNSAISVDWSHDGSRVGSIYSGRTVRIWDPATGQCISSFKGHGSGWFKSIAWSKDGSHVVLGYNDPKVEIWDTINNQCVSKLEMNFNAFLQAHEAFVIHQPAIDETFKLVTSNGYGLSRDYTWITYHGLNFLWLPMEYRPTPVWLHAIFNNKLAIACSSGHVIFLELAGQGPVTGH